MCNVKSVKFEQRIRAGIERAEKMHLDIGERRVFGKVGTRKQARLPR